LWATNPTCDPSSAKSRSQTASSARYNENVGKAFEGMIAEIEKGQEAGQPKEGNAKCAVM
jgi:hypothetical protein